MRVQHAIFNTPHGVDLTIEDRVTPDLYAHSLEGRDLGSTMPMWRVQTEGYTEGNDQLIGVVSSGYGFTDSPDTEWISGGVNSKGLNSVAIGRHGNFFHWGFAASPTYMTDEAKLVFINAVHYIAGFRGQKPVGHKIRGMVPRIAIELALDQLTEASYAATIRRYDRLRADADAKKQKVQARIDAGEDVSDVDKRVLSYPTIKTPGRFDRIKRYIPHDQWGALDGDEAAIAEYFRANLPYMRGDPENYSLVVDQELKQFGQPNNELGFLDRAVAAFGDKPVARTLLERYTEHSFDSAAEWGAWLKQNRDALFFTEVGGYKWVVNRRAKPVAATTSTAGKQ